MNQLREMAAEFLAQKRIAVAGVSRTNHNAPANLIYRKLRDTGHEVYAINPNASSVEDDPCYPTLRDLPKKVEAMVVATAPERAEKLVRDCADAGVSRVWLHRSFGPGSVTREAVDFCRQHGISVIAGGCPMMFCGPVDWGHRCMKWMLAVTGGLPH